jgi:hypothetical protein
MTRSSLVRRISGYHGALDPNPLSPVLPPVPPGERGLKKNLFLSPSSPGGRGGGWEKRAGVMRVNLPRTTNLTK